MAQYWLGVIGDIRVLENFQAHLWWCLPAKASNGDRIFMYCPRKLSAARQGIFVECELVSTPFSRQEENYRCSGYGQHFGREKSLGFTELKVVRYFEKHLTAKEMKRDSLLKEIGFVRRNFQGTTFSLSRKRARG